MFQGEKIVNVPFRTAVRSMGGYVPGEQPQSDGWIKLNTNENPYPPSQRVVEAIQQAAKGRLNVYPDPSAGRFREVAAQLFGVNPDWILPANGSDENLTIIVRSFCDPGDTIVYPYPSYVLYESLAQIQDCRIVRLPLDDQWQWDAAEAKRKCGPARICFVPNPNSPTGNRWDADRLAELVPDDGVLVLDEAYGDFAENPHQGELLRDPRFADRLICTRTLSKSYSLAGIRFGFSIACPELTAGMQKVKDSYNCDAVAIAAATAAIEDQEWMLENRRRILATRKRMAAALERLNFSVHPSQANFVWTTHASGQHRAIYESLKARQVLVRYMTFSEIEPSVEGLRITVGTDDEVDRLLEALTAIVEDL